MAKSIYLVAILDYANYPYFPCRDFLGLLVCHCVNLIEMLCGKINSVAICSKSNVILNGLLMSIQYQTGNVVQLSSNLSEVKYPPNILLIFLYIQIRQRHMSYICIFTVYRRVTWYSLHLFCFRRRQIYWLLYIINISSPQ